MMLWTKKLSEMPSMTLRSCGLAEIVEEGETLAPVVDGEIGEGDECGVALDLVGCESGVAVDHIGDVAIDFDIAGIGRTLWIGHGVVECVEDRCLGVAQVVVVEL